MPLACLGFGAQSILPRKETGLPGYAVGGPRQYIPNSRETLGTHRRNSRDFQGTRFSHLRARQDSLAIQSVPIEIFDWPAYHLLLVNTEDGRSNFTGQEEESPSCFADLAIQSVPSKILDGSPVRHSSIRTVSVSMLFTIGVSFIEAAVMHETMKSHLQADLPKTNQIQPPNQFARWRRRQDGVERPRATPQWESVHNFCKHWKPRCILKQARKLADQR